MASSKYITGTTRGVRIDKALLSRIQPSGARFDVWDAQLKGFHLRVGASGAITYAFYYRNRDGAQRKHTIGRDDKWTPKAARDEARRLIGSIADGEDPAFKKQETRRAEALAESRTLEALLNGDYWILYLASRRSGKATQERIRRAWRPFLDRDIVTITSQQLAAHRARRLRAGIKPQTLNRDRNALITLFSFAKEHGLVESNPLAAKAMRPLETAKDQRVRYLGHRDKDENHFQGERQRFMAALSSQSPLMQAVVGLALSTGMRRGEIFSLKWDQVDLHRRQLMVDASSSKSATIRQVPLNDNAMETLREWKKCQGNIVHLSGLVFPSPQTGTKLVTLKNAWRRLVAEAEVEDFRFHDCRHDYASRLVQAGVPLYDVSKLLGHASLELTQRYAHLSDEGLLKAARRAEL